MVLTNKYTETLILKFSNFANSNSLKTAISLYEEDDKMNACAILSGLTYYVVDELIKKNHNITKEEIEIYNYIEEIREKFSDNPKGTPEYEIDNAVCTCFLENLLNRASGGRIQFSRFIPFLGKKSKEYCRAWDEFTGVKSPGLW